MTQPTPSVPVVLCADDYGISNAVSRGILELLSAGRLSATSVMVNGRAGADAHRALARLTGKVGIGLHLNLTCGAPLGAMPVLAPAGRLPNLRRIITGAAKGYLPSWEVASEIACQLAAFRDLYGRDPDFVDGHQHVHALPGLRRLVLDLVEGETAGRPWLRDPADEFARIARRPCVRKAVAVASLAAGFGRSARERGLRTNLGFSGFSDFGDDAAEMVGGAFRVPGPAHLAMCHPGHVDDDLRALDPVVGSRERELAYLASDAFGALLREGRFDLVPAPRTAT